MRESFIFYRNWLESIKNLPREMQGDVLMAIIEYGLQGETTASLEPITKAMLAMVKPQIDINNQRFENGCKGGRRSVKRNQNETETEPKRNQNETETEPKRNQNVTETEPKPNQNVTETEPKPNQNETETEPKPNQNVTKTKPKQNQNVTETEPKPNQNVTKTKPKQNQNVTETEPKPNQNETETNTNIYNIYNKYNNIKESLTNVRDEKKVAADAATRTKKRQEKFYESLLPYLERYPPKMLREFFDYWTEPNKSRTKMRFELEKTWELGRRLATWAKREKMNGNNINKTVDTEQRIIQTGVAGINYFETMRKQDLAARTQRDMAGHTEDIQP